MGNDALVLLAALASIQLARGLTTDQLGLLSAFFEMLGDNLALLALSAPSKVGDCSSSGE